MSYSATLWAHARRIFLERSPRGIGLRVGAWYLLFCGLLWLVQEDLLFHPTPTTREEWHAGAAKLDLKVLSGFDALVGEPQGAARSTVVVFHGAGDNALVRAWAARYFTGQGHRVVLAEYPGFGPRPGSPSKEGILEDGRRLLTHVRQSYPGALQLWGESLGSGVAAQLATEEEAAGRPLVSLTLVVPYDRLTEVTDQMTWHLFPTALLLQHGFDNTKTLQHYRGVVNIVVAKHDDLIGPEQGRKLHRHLSTKPGQYFEISSGHNRWARAVPDLVWAALLDSELKPASARP